jgi:hypothetical protein
MAKKRPQYVQDLVNKANEHLRVHKVKDEYTDNLFTFVCDYLLKRDMYEGYNYFKMEYNTYIKKDVMVYAGSHKKDEFDFLQIM